MIRIEIASADGDRDRYREQDMMKKKNAFNVFLDLDASEKKGNEGGSNYLNSIENTSTRLKQLLIGELELESEKLSSALHSGSNNFVAGADTDTFVLDNDCGDDNNKSLSKEEEGAGVVIATTREHRQRAQYNIYVQKGN